jgi:hypothetical protein
MNPVATLERIITKDNLEPVGLLYEPKTKTNKVLVHKLLIMQQNKMTSVSNP